MKRYSTTKLLGFLYGDALNAYKRYYSYYGPNYIDPSQRTRVEVREELRRRYEHGLDCKMIENTFIAEDDENTVWLHWQKRKRKLAAVRYQNPMMKRMEGYEVFVDEDVLNGSNLWFDDVIWIKKGGCLFDGGGKLLNDIIDTLLHDYGLDAQYVGIGKDIWLAVLDEDNLNAPIDYDDEFYAKNKKVENHKNKMAQACHLIEMLSRRTSPRTSVFARACAKNYLLGKYVLEIFNLEKFIASF